MSRGRGKVQRWVIDQLSPGGPRLQPVQVLAASYAKDAGLPVTPHLRSSFRRAVDALAREGAVRLWDVPLPTRFINEDRGDGWGKIRHLNVRLMLCASRPDVEEITDDDLTAARLGLWMHEAVLLP